MESQPIPNIDHLLTNIGRTGTSQGEVSGNTLPLADRLVGGLTFLYPFMRGGTCGVKLGTNVDDDTACSLGQASPFVSLAVAIR